LLNYFNEAKKHISKIDRAKNVLKNSMPLNKHSFQNLSEMELDKIDILIFRFSKLQDLLGQRVFRNILEYSGFNTNSLSFVKILGELEKEGLLEIDRWRDLRDARNSIAHEYPNEEEILINEINYIYKEVSYLIELLNLLERYFYEIDSK
jgi:hypothetical protein